MPYIPLIAPQTPEPNYEVARMVAASDPAGSFLKGFSAVTHANNARRQNELAIQKMAHDEASSEADMAYKRDALKQNYSLQNADLAYKHSALNQAAAFQAAEMDYKRDSLDQNYELQSADQQMKRELQPYSIATQKAHSELYTAQAKLAANSEMSAAAMTRQRFEREAEREAEFNNDVSRTGVLDPGMNPVDLYKATKDLQQRYGFFDSPKVQSALKELKNRAENKRLQVVVGAEWSNNTKAFSGGRTTDMPIGEIAEKLDDKFTRDEMFEVMRASGNMVPDPNGKYISAGAPADEKERAGWRFNLKPDIARYIEGSKYNSSDQKPASQAADNRRRDRVSQDDAPLPQATPAGTPEPKSSPAPTPIVINPITQPPGTSPGSPFAPGAEELELEQARNAYRKAIQRGLVPAEAEKRARAAFESRGFDPSRFTP